MYPTFSPQDIHDMRQRLKREAPSDESPLDRELRAAKILRETENKKVGMKSDPKMFPPVSEKSSSHKSG